MQRGDKAKPRINAPKWLHRVMDEYGADYLEVSPILIPSGTNMLEQVCLDKDKKYICSPAINKGKVFTIEEILKRNDRNLLSVRGGYLMEIIANERKKINITLL